MAVVEEVVVVVVIVGLGLRKAFGLGCVSVVHYKGTFECELVACVASAFALMRLIDSFPASRLETRKRGHTRNSVHLPGKISNDKTGMQGDTKANVGDKTTQSKMATCTPTVSSAATACL